MHHKLTVYVGYDRPEDIAWENWQDVDYGDLWCAERDMYLASPETSTEKRKAV